MSAEQLNGDSQVKTRSVGSNQQGSVNRTASEGIPKSVTSKSSSARRISKPIRTSTTRPDEMLRHDISDDELDKLAANNTDTNLLWTCVGGVIGGASPVAEKIRDAFLDGGSKSFDFIGVFQISLLSVCLAASIYLGIKQWKCRNEVQNMVAKIRDRKRS